MIRRLALDLVRLNIITAVALLLWLHGKGE